MWKGKGNRRGKRDKSPHAGIAKEATVAEVSSSYLFTIKKLRGKQRTSVGVLGKQGLFIVYLYATDRWMEQGTGGTI